MVSVIQDDLIGSLIPDVYISRITLESQDSADQIESLVITVDLLLKEKLDNDLIGTWFSNKDITKYLNLHIYQSTDPLLTSFLSLGSDAIDVVDSTAGIPEQGVLPMLAKSVFGTQDYDQINQMIRTKSDSRIVSVKTDVVGTDSKLSQYKSTVDDDGNTVYNITYQAKFEVASTNKVEHLAYFAVSKFDFQELARDFELNTSNFELKGKVISEIVIDNFKTVSNSFYYCDEQQRIWTGEVHTRIDENGNRAWYSKRRGDPNSIRLNRKSTIKSKIQDLRIRKNLERLTIDLSQIENQVNSKNVTKRLTNDVIESKRKESYFSEMYVTRNSLGQSKFFFSVDFEKLFVDNTFFGGLIRNNPDLANDLVSKSSIKSLNIYRRRVKEDSSLTLAGNQLGFSPFDDNEPWELIANSKDFISELIPLNSDKSSLKEVKLANTGMSVRHFTGMDKTAPELTDGLYQYVVELDIADTGIGFIKQRIRELQQAKSTLEEYLSESELQFVPRFLTEVRDPHTERPSESVATSGPYSGNYDSASNRFTQNFIQKMERRYGFSISDAPWIVAPSVYLSVLKLFTTPTSDLETAVFSFVNPRTGNPTGISAVVGLIDNMISVLSKNVDGANKTSTRNFTNGLSQLPTGKNKNTSGLKNTFKIIRAFDSIFDTEITKGLGIDYLSQGVPSPSNTDGLRVFSGDDYTERVRLETLNYFNSEVVDTTINNNGKTLVEDSTQSTSFTYFSPARIDFPQQSVIILPGSSQEDLETNTNTIRRIDDGKIGRRQSFFELQSALIYHSSIDNSAGLVRSDDKTVKKNKRKKQSKKNTFDSYNQLASSLGVSISPLATQTETNSNGTVTVIPSAVKIATPVSRTDNRGLPVRQITPDLSIESPTLVNQNNNKNNEELEAASFLMYEIIKPSLKKGNFRRRKTWLRKPDFYYDNGVSYDEKESLSSVRELLAVNLISEEEKTNNRVNSSTGARAGMKKIYGLRQTITEKQFQNFPNQIKSVFAQNYNPSSVTQIVPVSFTDTVQYRYFQAEELFRFGMINQVQYLAGYEKDSKGKIMIKQPIWENLTQQSYNNLTSRQILCRMKPFENSALGIRRNKGIDVYVYD